MLERHVLWVEEQSATAQGAWKGAWTHRRSKLTLLWRARGGGVRQPQGYFYLHTHTLLGGGCLFPKLKTAIAISDSRGRCSPPSLGMDGHHLWHQPPQGSPLRLTVKQSTTHCPHYPRNAHTLPLLLSKSLGATSTSLGVTTMDQGPEIRTIFCHIPSNCQSLSNQSLTTSLAHCLHLHGSMCRPYTSTTLSRG